MILPVLPRCAGWVAGCFLVTWLSGPRLLAQPNLADPLKAPPLTAAQQAQLQEAKKLGEQINKHRATGELAEAVALAEKKLALDRAVRGPAHADVADTLELLAELYELREEFAAARRVRQEVLAIWTQRPGDPDWRVADARWALANLEALMALDPDQRRRLAEAALLNRKLEGLYAQGKAREALPLMHQVLAIHRQVLGPEHPHTLQSLNNLGELLRLQGDYGAARLAFEQALTLRRKVFGPEHPETGTAQNNLGMLLREIGDHAAARPYLEQALAIRQKAMGPEHSRTTTSLNNLGLLLREMGDHAAARGYYEQALAIRQKVLGPEDPLTTGSLINLGALLHILGDDAAARPYLEQALAIQQKTLGPEHVLTASSHIHLGKVLAALGEYAAARPHLDHALAIRQKTLGPEHPQTASSLLYLGVLFEAMGDFPAARSSLEQGLAINEKALGPEHPHTAISLNHLGGLLHEMGDPATARQHVERSLRITHQHLEQTFAAQSERQQLALAEVLRSTFDRYLSLAAVADLPVTSTYRELLAWKGAVYAHQRRLRLARIAAGADVAPLVAELQQTSSRLATLAFATPAPKQRGTWQRQLRDLTDRKERLERDLAARSPVFQREQALARRTPQELQAALPPGVVLIDFLDYTRWNPPSAQPGKWRREQHLAAFVVRADCIVPLDLGPIAPLDTAIKEWHAALTEKQPAADSDADPLAVLRRRLWQPLEPHLSGVRAVLVSPDGPLARFPLAALPGSRPGTYLLEELPIAVVPVPQMLPELLASERSAHTGPSEPSTVNPPGAAASLLLVGDVDFGASPGQPLLAQVGSLSRAAAQGPAALHFPLLPGTAKELEAIRTVFQQTQPEGTVTEVRQAAATEAAFREQAPRRRYLHLATHGFFAPAEVKSALGRFLDAYSEGRSMPAASSLGDRDTLAGWHPGLLSGLVLAGANRRPETAADGSRQTDDGILTALEVAEMDLSDTQLVVLSACETGLGKETSGEGLLGLQRAFQVSGARTVVASLWQVDDEATQQLMTRFYDNLWRKRQGALEALRQAQLSILNGPAKDSSVRGLGQVEPVQVTGTKGRAHPRLWAAWVLSGDPGNLQGADALPASASPRVERASAVVVAEETAPRAWLVVLVGGFLLSLIVLAWLRRGRNAFRTPD